jgi:eukaryotic translation initiation factor 2C
VNLDKGTVIDDVVTSPEGGDFYLCSQEGRIGTSRPAYYKVKHDDLDVDPDDLQVILMI